jgi:hypothetical protein
MTRWVAPISSAYARMALGAWGIERVWTSAPSARADSSAALVDGVSARATHAVDELLVRGPEVRATRAGSVVPVRASSGQRRDGLTGQPVAAALHAALLGQSDDGLAFHRLLLEEKQKFLIDLLDRNWTAKK